MATESSYINDGNGSVDPCEIKATDQLGDYPTIRSLLNALKDKLQTEKEMNPTWDSTTQLEAELVSLDTEYASVPTIISAYKEKYEDIKTKLKGYKDYEKQLNSMTNDPEWEDIRNAIDRLRTSNYSGTKLYEAYDKAWQAFMSIKSCYEKAKEGVSTQPQNAANAGSAPAPRSATGASPSPAVALIPDRKKRGAKDDFLYYKDYKAKIEAFFAVLDELKGVIDKVDDGNIRVKYAYYLEFKEALDNVRNLSPDDCEPQKTVLGKPKKKDPPKDEEWLRTQLMEKFKEWAHKAYKRFYWHRSWIAKEKEVAKTWDKYAEFLKNRKAQFISEAEEVPITVSSDECEPEAIIARY